MWKAIFTGAVCLVLALACGVLGVVLYRETPWLSVSFAAVDIGIVFGGLKTVLDTTKTANELRKMTLDIRKLEMEIEEKKEAARKAGTQVVVATLEEIKHYATPSLNRKISSSTRLATIVTSIVMIVAVGATLRLTRLPPPTSSQLPTSPPPTNQGRPSRSLPPPTYKPLPKSPSLPKPASSDKVADDFYKLASDLFDEGEYCEALTFIDEAIRRVPSKKNYQILRHSLRMGCNAQ